MSVKAPFKCKFTLKPSSTFLLILTAKIFVDSKARISFEKGVENFSRTTITETQK